MKQAKKHKRKFVDWPVIGKAEQVSIYCRKGEKLTVYRGMTQINIDSDPAKKILRFFGNISKFIDGHEGYAGAVMVL